VFPDKVLTMNLLSEKIAELYLISKNAYSGFLYAAINKIHFVI
jgi:hypothetical protein